MCVCEVLCVRIGGGGMGFFDSEKGIDFFLLVLGWVAVQDICLLFLCVVTQEFCSVMGTIKPKIYKWHTPGTDMNSQKHTQACVCL